MRRKTYIDWLLSVFARLSLPKVIAHIFALALELNLRILKAIQILQCFIVGWNDSCLGSLGCISAHCHTAKSSYCCCWSLHIIVFHEGNEKRKKIKEMGIRKRKRDRKKKIRCRFYIWIQKGGSNAAHAMPTHGLLNRGCLAIEIIMVRKKSDGERESACTPHSLVPLYATRYCWCLSGISRLHKYDAAFQGVAVYGYIAIIHRQIGHTPSRSHCILYLTAVHAIYLFSRMQKRLMMISCTPNKTTCCRWDTP